RLTLNIKQLINLRTADLGMLSAQLIAQTPNHHIEQLSQRVKSLQQRSQLACQQALKDSQRSLANLAHRLDTLSPLATLSRGYSITKDAKGRLIKDAAGANIGDTITTTVNNGSLTSQVTKVSKQVST
ncbi:MAG: hypothetical protein COC19_01000, partial [SAR86 cluster bacterium]